MGCCNSLIDVLGDNSVPEDAEETEQGILNEHPRILKEGEKIVMAFRGHGGKGRDMFMFTSHRILVRDVQGMTGTSLEYRSCPYHTIRAFSVETAGRMDRSVEVRVWAMGVGKIKVSIVYDQVDIFAIKRLLNSKVLKINASDPKGQADAPEGVNASQVMKFLDVLGDNARMLDPKETESSLRSECDFLVDDEVVELAYKCGRDFTCFTNKRILTINVKGLTGLSREYRSILWEYCSAFSVETAGKLLDMDAEMTIYMRVTGMESIGQDFRKGGANVMEVQEYLSNKLLGLDTKSEVGIPKTPDDNAAYGEKSSWGKAGDFLAFLGDDMKMIDPAQANAQFHAGGDAPILQGCESVEMAFKGRRDMIVLTTKRFLDIDIEGLISKSTKYTSIPWKAIKAFSIQSAGMLDNDSEFTLWTEFNDIEEGHPAHGEDDEEKLPVPHWSCKEVNLRKDKVDLFAIQRYLAQRIIPGGDTQQYNPPELQMSGPIKDMGENSGIIDWIFANNMQIDPKQIDEKFKVNPPILLADESSIQAFKCGRDFTVFTTKRILKIDTEGISGKSVEYKSIPYASIKAFSVESAGSWDRDAELKVMVQAPWEPLFSMDFRKGQADIMFLQNFIAQQVLGSEDMASGLSAEGAQAAAQAAQAASANAGTIGQFFDWIGDNYKAISAEEVNSQFHTSPPILLSDEKAELAFKCGRDLFVVTTLRFLKVDTQGFTGQKVEYFSVPMKSCASFAVSSAGAWDFDGEFFVSTDITSRGYYGDTWDHTIAEDLSKGKTDMFVIQEFFNNKLLK